MAKEAKDTAFCLSTDATGVCIQPEPSPVGSDRPAARATSSSCSPTGTTSSSSIQPKHTSAAVCEMFRGFAGYIQADAHAIYDAIFRGEARAGPEDEPPPGGGLLEPLRRKAWEAAVVAKDAAAREALLRMRKLFELEEQWAALAPAQRHARRQLVLRPLVDDFFAWAPSAVRARQGHARPRRHRLRLRRPAGAALRRFLDDGRLPMTNNHSERALQGHRARSQGLALLRLRRPRQRRRQPLLAHRLLRAAPARPRDLPGRDHPRAALLAARPLPRAGPQVLGRHPRPHPAAELAVEIGDITVPPPLPPKEQPATR